MTSIQVFSIVWLAVVFTVCIWRHINLGLAMLPAAFVLAEIAGITPKQLYQGFPTSLVILILGVMFLWNHARNSGLADLIVHRTVELARGRVWLLPWVTCALSAAICAIGALPAAALVITLPVAIRMAEQENIRPALMGIVTIQGACIGGFSPISPWGSLVSAQATHAGLPFLSGHFMLAQIALNLIVACIAFFAFGGAELIRREAVASVPKSPMASGAGWHLTVYQWSSLVAVCVFVAMVLMKFDVGLSAFAIGIVLHIAFRGECQKAIAALPWGIIIMIAGLIIYVSLLEQLGVLHVLGEKLTSVDNPSLVLMAVTYLGTLVANFESSSVAVLGLVIPVAVKSLANSPSEVINSLSLAMVAGSVTVIASSPFHLCGGIVLAETRGDNRTFKDLLIWTAATSALLPLCGLII
jgi:Na+/H+ antiporter NhaD/arsenite permease-like protein